VASTHYAVRKVGDPQPRYHRWSSSHSSGITETFGSITAGILRLSRYYRHLHDSAALSVYRQSAWRRRRVMRLYITRRLGSQPLMPHTLPRLLSQLADAATHVVITFIGFGWRVPPCSMIDHQRPHLPVQCFCNNTE